ncbi:MAG: MAPEG family protein [Hyphomicrobiaceae bacterium]
MIPVTTALAGLLAIIYVVLAFRVIRMRYALRVGVGDKGDRVLQRRIRVHANFSEYVPIALILMALLELAGVSRLLLAVLAVALLLGRLSHAYGVSQEPETLVFRQAGMIATFLVILAMAVTALTLALPVLFRG